MKFYRDTASGNGQKIYTCIEREPRWTNNWPRIGTEVTTLYCRCLSPTQELMLMHIPRQMAEASFLEIDETTARQEDNELVVLAWIAAKKAGTLSSRERIHLIREENTKNEMVLVLCELAEVIEKRLFPHCIALDQAWSFPSLENLRHILTSICGHKPIDDDIHAVFTAHLYRIQELLPVAEQAQRQFQTMVGGGNMTGITDEQRMVEDAIRNAQMVSSDYVLQLWYVASWKHAWDHVMWKNDWNAS